MMTDYFLEEKRSLARHLNPANHHLVTIRKAHKDFAKRLDIIEVKLPVKITNIQKMGRKDSVGISFFGY